LNVILKFDAFLNDLGKRIKRFRIEKKLTQSGLASLIDVDIRTIQRIEKGEMNLSIKLLLGLSAVLEKPVSLLIGEIQRNDDTQENEA
jgi:transcriptional regulator with XRE-family HTH domain